MLISRCSKARIRKWKTLGISLILAERGDLGTRSDRFLLGIHDDILRNFTSIAALLPLSYIQSYIHKVSSICYIRSHNQAPKQQRDGKRNHRGSDGNLRPLSSKGRLDALTAVGQVCQAGYTRRRAHPTAVAGPPMWSKDSVASDRFYW